MTAYFVERWKGDDSGELLLKTDNLHDANEVFNAYKDLIKAGETLIITLDDFEIKRVESEAE